MIVLIGGERGGAGKTTLDSNLAAMRVPAGHDLLQVDTDHQGSANYLGAES
jgi:chromosome partitioning protein